MSVSHGARAGGNADSLINTVTDDTSDDPLIERTTPAVDELWQAALESPRRREAKTTFAADMDREPPAPPAIRAAGTSRADLSGLPLHQLESRLAHFEAEERKVWGRELARCRRDLNATRAELARRNARERRAEAASLRARSAPPANKNEVPLVEDENVA